VIKMILDLGVHVIVDFEPEELEEIRKEFEAHGFGKGFGKVQHEKSPKLQKIYEMILEALGE